MAHPFLSFELSDEFVDYYSQKPIQFGYPCGGGNSLGEILFLRSYSRKKDDGTKERWHEMNRRVIEGMYSIQKDHITSRRMRWNELQGQESAQEAYDRLNAMKWTPPGRGMFAMGSRFVHERRNSAPLFNCAVTEFSPRDVDKYIADAAWLMEACALGIGVGFRAMQTIHPIYEPRGLRYVTNQEIAELSGDPDGLDSREGWCTSLVLLLEAYLKPGKPLPRFDYSPIRSAGSELKSFGGTASGPEALISLHKSVREQFMGRYGELVSSRDTTDLGNKIGKCIVAGSMRRSAELVLGSPFDQDFLSLKDWTLPENFERMDKDGWGSLSNNSVEAYVGMDYSGIVEKTKTNGEPGYIYLDMLRNYGRMADGYRGDDRDIIATNPCAEIGLADRELCCLSTIHLNRADDKEDFLRTVKFAYLYAKTVLLLPTHWPETNTVMLRNQRIGLSLTGVADFVDKYGWNTLREWMNEGYQEVQKWDEKYSSWLCVRTSKRTTTMKPEGSTSLLTGASPGDHWKTAEFMIRGMRLTTTDPLVAAAMAAGYKVEPDNQNPLTSSVVYFPVATGAVRAEHEVSIYEKAALAAETQHWWADNAVSVTITFDAKREADDVEKLLHIYEGRLKTVSFLPVKEETIYEQMPEERVTQERVEELQSIVVAMDWNALYAGEQVQDAEDSKFCTNVGCTI